MSLKPFNNVAGLAMPMPQDNIDTDIIFPARFLLITAKDGLGEYAFYDRRFGAEGQVDADYVLNQARYAAAPIIVAGANFGCGSSREQAVWALVGLGIRAVIAPSFGEIFAANAMRNGVLPIVLPPLLVEGLTEAAMAGQTFMVDLPTQTVTVGAEAIPFTIDPDAKAALLNGWDETDQILSQYAADIAAFETRQRGLTPWLYRQEPPQ